MTDRVTLRPATMADAKILFEWRNDPETRQASHKNDTIRFDSHLAWLESSLNRPEERILWVAQWDGVAVGTCRADRIETAWLLSWTVAPEARGKGVAQKMLLTLVHQFNQPLVAQIKTENPISIKVAERVGFVLDREENGMCLYIYPRTSINTC